MIPWVLLAWAVILGAAALLYLLLASRPAAEPASGPRADPHAAAVAEFRRQIHDWDHRGA
jgi:hypothetical protein